MPSQIGEGILFSDQQAQLRRCKHGPTVHQDMHSGQLTLAVATTANQFASRLVGAFSKQNENITVRLDVTNRERLIEQLGNN